MKIGDKVNVRFNPNKDHFLSRIAKGMEKNIAYWSGANGAESARCLIQYIEDIKDPELSLTLFYSNPTLYAYELQYNNTVNVIYYNWLVDMAKKMENLKVVFTFPEKKNQISRVIILELFTGKVGSSLIQKENRRELFQNITGASRTPLTQYVEVVVSLTGLLNVKMDEWRGDVV